jgi:hypothetical protein
MKRLAPRVNVIPVIGKSDTLTPKELREFKKRVSRARRGRKTCRAPLMGKCVSLDHGGYRVLQYSRLQLSL